MELTIVICTHNRLELLQRTLHHLDRAERPAGVHVKVLVVANACVDGTGAWLERRRTAPPPAIPLRWIAELKPGKSCALNLALSVLDTPWVAFVDDDHRVAEDYLVQVAEGIRHHPGASFLCGRIIPDWDGSEPPWVHERGEYRIYPLPVPRFDLGDAPCAVSPKTAIPGGGNLIASRAALDRVGEFAPGLGPKGHDLSGSEDTDYVLRALSSGETIRYLPSIVQYHYVDTLRLRVDYLIRKSYQRSRSITRVKERHAVQIPPYLWRKALNYLAAAVLSMRWTKTRFFLVRLAATLGEMRGLLERMPATGAARRQRRA